MRKTIIILILIFLVVPAFAQDDRPWSPRPRHTPSHSRRLSEEEKRRILDQQAAEERAAKSRASAQTSRGMGALEWGLIAVLLGRVIAALCIGHGSGKK
jgi:hypothetical protein